MTTDPPSAQAEAVADAATWLAAYTTDAERGWRPSAPMQDTHSIISRLVEAVDAADRALVAVTRERAALLTERRMVRRILDVYCTEIETAVTPLRGLANDLSTALAPVPDGGES